MSFSTVRRDLGFLWFYLLSFFTTAVLISGDREIGSLQKALSSHLPGVFLFSIPVALIAIVPFVLFRRGRWLYGSLATLACGVSASGLLYSWQVNAPVPTIREWALAIAIVSGWLALIAFPAGFLAVKQESTLR